MMTEEQKAIVELGQAQLKINETTRDYINEVADTTVELLKMLQALDLRIMVLEQGKVGDYNDGQRKKSN